MIAPKRKALDAALRALFQQRSQAQSCATLAALFRQLEAATPS